MAATNPRRVTAKKTVRKPVPKPAPSPEAVEEQTETIEVPEAIQRVAEEAMEAQEVPDEELPFLTIEMIQRANDRTEKPITVKEWGGRLLLRSLSASAVMRLMGDEDREVTEDGGLKMDIDFSSMQKEIIQAGVVQPVITDAGWNIFMDKSAAPVMYVMNEIMSISNLKGLGSDKKTPKAVEDEVAKFRESGESE